MSCAYEAGTIISAVPTRAAVGAGRRSQRIDASVSYGWRMPVKREDSIAVSVSQ